MLDQKPDAQLRRDVIAALARDPLVDSAEIAVTVHEGAVTLAGSIVRYPEKLRAEQ